MALALVETSGDKQGRHRFKSIGGRRSTRVNRPLSCVTRFDRGVIADDISRALSCAPNKLFPESDGCSDASRITLICSSYIL